MQSKHNAYDNVRLLYATKHNAYENTNKQRDVENVIVI
jgi:hypothetical protein